MKLKLDLRQAKSAELLNGPSLKALWKRGGKLPASLLAPGGRNGGAPSSRSRRWVVGVVGYGRCRCMTGCTWVLR